MPCCLPLGAHHPTISSPQHPTLLPALPLQYENPLQGADATLLAAATKVHVGGHEHMLMCVVVRESTATNVAGSSLPGLTLHWSTAGKPGDKWRSPPSGWHTFPRHSKDAGGLAGWAQQSLMHRLDGMASKQCVARDAAGICWE
jgi:hypothetical protein